MFGAFDRRVCGCLSELRDQLRVGIAGCHIDDADVWSARCHPGEPALCIGDGSIDLVIGNVGLGMRQPVGVKLRSSGTEPMRNGIVVVPENDVVESGGRLRGNGLELVDEVRAPQVLRNGDVMPGGQVRPCERKGQHACLEPGFLMLGPAAHRHPKAVNLDDQGQWMLIEIPAGERRLANPRRAVEEDEARHHFMKKNVESTLAAKSSEDKQQRLALLSVAEEATSPEQARDMRRRADQAYQGYLKWRTGALRFRAGVEERLAEAGWRRRLAGSIIPTALLDERNQLLGLVGVLTDAIRAHKASMADLDPDDIDEADEILWATLEGGPKTKRLAKKVAKK